MLYSNEIGEERRRRILNLVAAYPYLLRQHIRPGCLCSNQKIPKEHRLQLIEHPRRHTVQETRHEGQEDRQFMNKTWNPPNRVCYVDKRELPWSFFMKSSLPQIARAENRPLFVCDRIATLIASIPYGPNFSSRERLAMIGMVDKLTNAIGQCERIHQTAVPLNYARHSLRSLTLWLFTLPFALVHDFGLFTPFVSASVAWLFFGVYQIGYSIGTWEKLGSFDNFGRHLFRRPHRPCIFLIVPQRIRSKVPCAFRYCVMLFAEMSLVRQRT